MWFASLGSFSTTTDFDPNDPEHRMIPPETIRGTDPLWRGSSPRTAGKTFQDAKSVAYAAHCRAGW